jgi:hypothetical protein
LARFRAKKTCLSITRRHHEQVVQSPFEPLRLRLLIEVYEGHPAPSGPALTNDLCGQDVKINVKDKINAVLTLILTF